MASKIICCVAGRSGGHIIPCLTFAKQQLNSEDSILFFSTNRPLDMHLAKQETVISKHIALHLEGIPYKKYGRIFHVISQAIWSFFVSLFWLIRYRPKKIISTGGYVSIPVCLAGKILRIPIELFELNAAPGKAALFLKHIADKIHVCFPQAKSFFNAKKCSLSPYPIRFSNINSEQEARAYFNIVPHKKVILILGGSQGSQFLNDLSLQLIQIHKKDQIHILHQTGNDTDTIAQRYDTHHISHTTFSFLQQTEFLYQASDLIICRAGAGTLFEGLFFKKQLIIIPLETESTDHQLSNAEYFSQTYPTFCQIFLQKQIDHNKELFMKRIQQLVD